MAKEALQANSLLVHHDPSKPLILACVTSQYGIGAVLSHITDNGEEHPIAYSSRTLNAAEKRYSQLEKEGLAIMSGVNFFHNYIYGRHFTIQSDQKPLSFLFQQGDSSACICSRSETGIDTFYLPLFNLLQEGIIPIQCGCTEQTSTSCYSCSTSCTCRLGISSKSFVFYMYYYFAHQGLDF